MESNRNDKDYQSLNIEIPKWLQEISRQITDDDDRNEGKIDVQKSLSEPHSAKYGRRSGGKTEDLSLIKLYPDRKQYDLEQSWRSLDKFQQSHKGRLDSANKPRRNSHNIDNLLALSPTIDNDENRSRSELSNYKLVCDPLFEKRLNEYRLKIDKENQLRQQIINELLLTDNENITNRFQFNDDYEFKQYTNSDNELFIIPELPFGKCLIIDILSTWGDKYYVGLNGIEIFDIDGRIVDVEHV